MIDEPPRIPTEDGYNPTAFEGEQRRTPTPFEITEGDHETFVGASDSAAEFQPGSVIADQFEVVRVLGRGGMGMVYEVTDRVTKQRLALKAILPSILSKPKAVDRFVQEVNTARRLRHPGIVAVYDVRQAGPLLLFTMEYLEGKTLREILNERGKLPLDETVALLEKLCDALEYAHQFTVHRDISPENVMLLPDGRVKLLDFGIAKSMDPSTYTATQMSMGKAYYMAPEQRKDAAAVDHRADIFPLGVMFFEMLTGEMPMGYNRLTDMAPDVPAECDEVIGKAIVPVGQRYNAVSEFRRAIHACEEVDRERRLKEEAAAEAAGRQREEEERARLAAAAAEKRRQEEGARIAAENRRRQEEAEQRKRWEEAEARRQGELAEQRERLEREERVGPAPTRSRVPLFIGGAMLIAVVVAVFLFARDEDGRGGPLPSQETEDGRPGGRPYQEPEPGELRTFAGIEMVWIPPGDFLMGSASSEENRDSDETQHRVTLSKGFWLGKYEVTQAEWQAVMGTTVAQQRDKANKEWPLRGEGSQYPMYYVSWNDCQEFIGKVNAKGQGTFRLPTEAEWEYACRAGTTTPFHFGETISTDQANYDGNYTYGSGKKGVYREKTVSVGSFPPNRWGLYDTHGNVWEWCQDWYGEYPSGSVTDPTGPSTGSLRVLRGGSWSLNPGYCRSAARSLNDPGNRGGGLGFRLARE